MQPIITCLQTGHDVWLLVLAALVCMIGVYGAFSVAQHAGRATGKTRTRLAITGLVAAGCTAWATHMIALLAFRPAMPAGFEPVLTALSLVLGILGISAGMLIAIGGRSRLRRLMGGFVLGLGVVVLHYVGQSAYVVRGHVTWNDGLVALSIFASLPLFSLSLMCAGERNRNLRPAAAPLLLLSIAVLHISGMAALQLTYDPRVAFPPLTLEPDFLAPLVATMSIGLFGVALLALSLTLRAKAKLREDRQRLGELANLALEGLAICENGIALSVNEGLARLAGRKRQDLEGRSFSELLPGVALEEIPEGEEVDGALATLSGQSVPVRVLRREFVLGRQTQTVVAFRDQRERLRSEAKIRRLAYTDTLTGLANREHFHGILEGCVTRHQASQLHFAILLFDLDGFKAVNDSLGHSGGDEVLKVVADRLSKCLDEGWEAARLSGDEFAVLIPDGADPLQATAVAERAIRAIEEPILLRDQVTHISASVGIKLSDGNSSVEQMLRNADLALYDAKANGRGHARLFTHDLRRAANDRATTAMELQDAFEDGDLELYYQPQVRLRDGALVGAEALIRWNYPYRGVLSPAAFLPVLESGPLAVPVGNWILSTACRQAARWRAEGLSDFRIGVNLFAAQLRSPDFVETVVQTLAECGLPAEALELEVTENIILRKEGATISHLAKLRSMGVGIAFDDFGTGYASLTMLKEIAITRLKVDRSFVREIEWSGKDQAIVDAIARMAKGCDLTVIAEGIETEEQADLMRDYADEGQGYLYGRPMTARAFEEHHGLGSAYLLPTALAG
ncbi:bifunctional diguanylate cyclase/phosphodiesterase [Jiella pelagia]|uniref:EAL domain-containing protein n=1 Tax=Jiella pelagia TaxID=2986949 RepID=A0ABY7C349_9HYPH|nr:EAL domain-containing protein [Jiella pelagia]WAP70133.1 EAL domain-containing protein [Jiella pelagia]